MEIIIHRGCNEVGGSCVEILGGNTRIVIDIGIPLVDKEGKKFNIKNYKSLQVNQLVERGVLPNIKGLYNWETEYKRVDGILLSHSHIDHYGLFNYLRDDVVYYLGQSTRNLIDLTSIFSSIKGEINNYIYIKNEKKFTIGEFLVTPFLMDHSAFDSYSFLIQYKDKSLIYSGDFRGHGRKVKVLDNFLNKIPINIDALILEGTMFGRTNKDSITEYQLEIEIQKLVRENDNITLINFSSQNIDRVVTMYKVALRNNKTFVIDFYTANILSSLGKKIPHPSKQFSNIKVFFPQKLCNHVIRIGRIDLIYKFSGYKITKQEIIENKESIMMIVRDSMLDYLKDIDIENGLFIYSMWTGYLKENSTKNLIDFAKLHNMKIINKHTGGHADIRTLKKVVTSINAKYIIPIHSFNPEDYFQIAGNIKLLSDGKIYKV